MRILVIAYLLVVSNFLFADDQSKTSITSDKTDIRHEQSTGAIENNASGSATPDVANSATLIPQNKPLSLVDSTSQLNTQSREPIVGSSNIVSMLFSLGAIVALILALAWVMRRLGGSSLVGGGPMKVVSALSLGTREKLLLVDVGGQQVLLGVAPGRVSYLKSFDEPIIFSNQASTEFAGKFKHYMSRNNSNETVHD